MFQELVQFLAGIPFFNSVIFGIIAMVIVGSSWCLVGLVMGDAPKKGIEPSLVQLSGAIFSSFFSVIIMIITSAYSTASLKVTLLTMLCYMLNGALNFIMLQIMSKAMQCGPNGVIWSIIQSALVFPFIVGIIFFDVKLTVLRGAGIILLLTALVIFACSKDNSVKGGNWKILAFLALFITAIQQNLSTLPSYFEAALGVPSIVRALSTASGTLIAAVILNLVRMNREHWNKLKSNFRNFTLWKYVGTLQLFSLLFSYTLFYPGMNIMAKAGMGGMCYPMMVGSCIVSFSLASIVILKEKIRFIQIFGLIVCVSGLILICTKA